MGKYKIGLNRPESPQGELFEVPPVGLIENMGHVVAELDDDTAKALMTAYGIIVEKSSEPLTEVNSKVPGYSYQYVEEVEVERTYPPPIEAEVEEGGETS